MSYYAVDLTGMMDLRTVRGPFKEVMEAKIAAEEMNKARCKGWFTAQEPLYVAVNKGYVNGPFRSAKAVKADMKEVQADSTIGAGTASFAGLILELLIGLHQSFADTDTVTGVVKRIPTPR